MIITQFESLTNPVGRRVTCTWPALCEAMQHDYIVDKSIAHLWSPVAFSGNRSKANAVEVWCCVLDFDGLTDEQAIAVLGRVESDGIATLIYTTHSHGNEDVRVEKHHAGVNCFRLVRPLAAPIPAAEWPAYWRAFAASWGVADAVCKDVSRAYYDPSARPGAEAWIVVVDGAPLAVTLVAAPPIAVPAINAMAISADRLKATARRWSRAGGTLGELGDRLTRALGGEAYASPGERDTITFDLCIRLVREYPRIDGAEFARTLGPAIHRMGPWDAPIDVAGKIERARAIVLAGDDREPFSYDPNREHDAVVFTMRKLAESGRFYGFGGILVEPRGDQLDAIDAHRLRSQSCAPIDWRRETADGPVKIGMPHTLAAAVLAAPLPREMPDVRGIAYAPIGDVAEGYDPDTRYLVRGAVISRRDDIATSAAELLAIVQDFEWSDDVSPGVWLAALLTLFARPQIAGAVPLFLIDKNDSGTGGTLLAQALAEIYLGRPVGMTDYVHDRDEWRKTLFACALQGAPLVVLDNINGRFGDDVLNQAITAGVINGRVLGRSQVRAVPCEAVFVANGVNLEPRGDLLRRCVRARIDTTSEAPGKRTGFAFPDLIGHVRANRARLAAAAIALLRDVPAIALEPFGSFETWAVVRRAVMRVGLPDPVASRASLADVASDVGDAQVPALLIDTLRALGATSPERAITTLQLARDGGRTETYTAALSLLPENTGARQLAAILRRSAGRVFAQGVLRRGKLLNGQRKWFINGTR